MKENRTYRTFLEMVGASSGIAYADIVDLENGATLDRFESPFFTALVWHEILSMELEASIDCMDTALEFLKGVGSEKSGWRFFPDGRGYPPDADDTAVIAHLLLRARRLDDPTSVVKILLKNSSGDGKFFVWLQDAAEIRKDCTSDDVVNCNVRAFLLEVLAEKSACVPLPIDLLTQMSVNLASQYYDNPSVRLWFRCRLDETTIRLANKLSPLVSCLSKEQIDQALRKINECSDFSRSVACKYGSSTGRSRPTEIQWVFRHQNRPRGYSCALFSKVLELSAELHLAAHTRQIGDLLRQSSESPPPDSVFQRAACYLR